MIQRRQILNAIESRLQPLPAIIAMWQGGAAAFDRVDEWSDIDVQLGVEDDSVELAFEEVEKALRRVESIDERYRTPMPTWHGHAQGVFRLQNISPFLFIDLVVMKRTSKKRFLEPEIHGDRVVHFDKEDWLNNSPFDDSSFDEATHRQKLRETLKASHQRFKLLQVLTLKELERGNDIEAYTFYQSCTLRPYVNLLRMKHSPTRFQFHTRYIHYELPADEVERVRRLTFVKDASELRAYHSEVEQLFLALHRELAQQLES